MNCRKEGKGKQAKEAKVYGVDGLRLWVCAHAAQSALIPTSEAILATTKQDLERIRKTFR